MKGTVTAKLKFISNLNGNSIETNVIDKVPFLPREGGVACIMVVGGDQGRRVRSYDSCKVVIIF